jgi:hypothetical protein
MVDKLEQALVSGFPPITIDRALIDETTASWDAYEDHADLVAFEGKTWRSLAPELLKKHSTLPVFAGDGLWRAMLPGYLWYVLHERALFNELPFQLASQLTRKEDPASHPRFDRRISAFSTAQRAVIRDVVALLATVSPLEESMSRALATWDEL